MAAPSQYASPQRTSQSTNTGQARRSHYLSSSGLLGGPDEPACQLGLIRVISKPKDPRPELLRRPLQRGQVERVAFQRLEGRSLAPATIGQEPGSLQPVGVAAGLVAGDIPLELSECHPVLADQLAGGTGEALRPAAGVAGDPLRETA
jgi:hypothetical protein